MREQEKTGVDYLKIMRVIGKLSICASIFSLLGFIIMVNSHGLSFLFTPNEPTVWFLFLFIILLPTGLISLFIPREKIERKLKKHIKFFLFIILINILFWVFSYTLEPILDADFGFGLAIMYFSILVPVTMLFSVLFLFSLFWVYFKE